MTQGRHETPTEADADKLKAVRITLPFKDQKSADIARQQLKDLGRKIGTDLQPVFTSRKIEEKLKIQEEKPASNVIRAMRTISDIPHAIFINA